MNDTDLKDTLLKWFVANILPLLLTAVLAAVSWAIAWFGNWLRSKSKTLKLARVADRVFAIVQAVVHQVDVVVVPMVAKAAEDGVITKAEGDEIRTKALIAVKQTLGDATLKELREVMKFDTETALGTFLVGTIERVLQQKKIAEAPLEVLPMAVRPPEPLAPSISPAGF